MSNVTGVLMKKAAPILSGFRGTAVVVIGVVVMMTRVVMFLLCVMSIFIGVIMGAILCGVIVTMSSVVVVSVQGFVTVSSFAVVTMTVVTPVFVAMVMVMSIFHQFLHQRLSLLSFDVDFSFVSNFSSLSVVSPMHLMAVDMVLMMGVFVLSIPVSSMDMMDMDVLFTSPHLVTMSMVMVMVTCVVSRVEFIVTVMSMAL
jgi:hypothetical protein